MPHMLPRSRRAVGNAGKDAALDRGWLLGYFKDASDPRHRPAHRRTVRGVVRGAQHVAGGAAERHDRTRGAAREEHSGGVVPVGRCSPAHRQASPEERARLFHRADGVLFVQPFEHPLQTADGSGVARSLHRAPAVDELEVDADLRGPGGRGRRGELRRQHVDLHVVMYR